MSAIIHRYSIYHALKDLGLTNMPYMDLREIDLGRTQIPLCEGDLGIVPLEGGETFGVYEITAGMSVISRCMVLEVLRETETTEAVLDVFPDDTIFRVVSRDEANAIYQKINEGNQGDIEAQEQYRVWLEEIRKLAKLADVTHPTDEFRERYLFHKAEIMKSAGCLQ